jgi:glycosyltransferase involved in cell wall biosynthesis
MKSLLNGKPVPEAPALYQANSALHWGKRVSVVDPSLFTLPYDQALVRALLAVGLDVELVGRPPRPGEAPPSVPFRASCYRRFDSAPRRLGAAGALLKAGEHLVDALHLAHAATGLTHLQWLAFPLADALALRLARRRGPLVVTVHDTTPFNGSPSHPLQAAGFRAALAAADRLIVHTAGGRKRLAALGIPPERIAVVPHGPLGESGPGGGDRPRGPRLTLVVFGKIRRYKGLDVLVEALARLDPAIRAGLRVIVAGEPLMDLGPLRRHIADADLGCTVDLIPRRLDEPETRALLEAADGFVFPYREIEASGVFYLVQGLGRWLIASRLGAFAEAIEDGVSGRLVPPEDPDALAAALREAALFRPRPAALPRVTGWDAIARTTAAVYAAAWSDWAAGRRPATAPALATR